MRATFVLYVRDQKISTAFYRGVLAAEPVLDVPGMTMFALGEGATLGLMPEAGIVRLLEEMKDPALGSGIPRAELYLQVDDPAAHHARALAGGATELSPLLDRDWGDRAAYSADPDGHILALAAPLS